MGGSWSKGEVITFGERSTYKTIKKKHLLMEVCTLRMLSNNLNNNSNNKVVISVLKYRSMWSLHDRIDYKCKSSLDYVGFDGLGFKRL